MPYFTGSKTLFGRRKRNSRSKDVSVFDKSSEEETIYSAQVLTEPLIMIKNGSLSKSNIFMCLV